MVPGLLSGIDSTWDVGAGYASIWGGEEEQETDYLV